MKKSIGFSIVLLVSAAMIISCRSNKNGDLKRTVTVSGEGTVAVAPDMACIDFSVTKSGWESKKIVPENAAVMTKVIEAIKASGVGANDIVTSEVSIRQDKSWQNGVLKKGQYVATNQIHVTVRNIQNPENIGNLIDAAVSAGANGIDSLSFGVSDTQTAVRQARTAAVKQAQDAASLLAGSSGCKLGAVISIDENGNPSASHGMFMKAMAVDNSVSTPIELGKIKISANVTITYELQ